MTQAALPAIIQRQDASGEVRAPPEGGNNFHLLRLIFAAMVAAYHLLLLPGVGLWSGLVDRAALGAELGVQGFFVLSGFLVAGSLERSRTLGLYTEKRVRRLYPAYAIVVIACALAAFAFSAEARERPEDVGAYLGWNLIFLNFMQPELPGLFVDNPFTVVNGALWTLKIEVMFYIALPLLALLLRWADRWRWLVMAAIYLLAEVWRIGLREMHETGGAGVLFVELSRQLPGQMSFFITGVALYLLRERIAHFWPAAPVGALLLAASIVWPEAEPLRAAGLGLLTVWLAVGTGVSINAARFGDLSYGVYIIHFPVIQALTALALFERMPLLAAAAAVAITLVLALLLWRLVERPFLRADSAYRLAPARASG